MSAPTPNDLVAAKEAEVDRIRRNLEIAEAELRGMRVMLGQPSPKKYVLSAEPAKITIKPGEVDGIYRGGRQPGSISQPWRRILSQLYWRRSMVDGPGQRFAVGAVIDAAAREGLRLRPSEAESRLLHYRQFNYVSVADSEGRYAITQVAADRFGFRQAPLKNEAPSAEAPGPHQSVEDADQTDAVEPSEKGDDFNA